MLAGPVALLGTYFAVFALHALLPGRVVEGYACDAAGRRLRYRLNGLRVFALVIGGWLGLTVARVVPPDFVYLHRFSMLATACTLGIVFTLAIVLPAPRTGKPWFAELYLGRLENPRALGGRVDAKMFLYLVGAIMLELCLSSCASHHRLVHAADSSPGVLLYTALFSFFVVEYLAFERVHLYTYDFVAERVGFKLTWGCLAFYPFFYCIGLWFAAAQPNPHSSAAWLLGSAALFFAGWVLARGANLQKYVFKTQPERASFGPFAQRALTAGDKRVLVGGFWGVARHVNYLGELCMASGLALSLGYPRAIWPWLYPLYYVALLVPRQLDDDRRCAEKYGALWEEYRRAVPYRIIPWVY
jgi:delta14-sterol reductase